MILIDIKFDSILPFFHNRSNGRSNLLFNRKLDKFDWIFLFFASLMIPMVLLEYLIGIPSALAGLFRSYYLLLWTIFAAEFIVRLYSAKNKLGYFVKNWIKVVIVFFPFLRFFRLIQIFQVAFLILIDRFSKTFPILRKHAFFNLLVFVCVVAAVSTELILRFEAPHANSQIKTFGDAIWWSTVGVSTIGLGNLVPESAAGRYLTVILMVIGVFVFSVFTAQIASIFTEQDVKEDINKELSSIEGGLSKVEKDIAGEIAVEDKTVEDKLDRLEKEVEQIKKKA